jgi:pre-rRNA-processing protein TSR3
MVDSTVQDAESGRNTPADDETSPRFPPTVIVVHPREKRSKCSVEALRARDDFSFFTFPNNVTVPLDTFVRLGMGGEELSEADAAAGLLVLDGTWKLAEKMEPFYQDVPIRTLPLIRTAYPRTSKIFQDPAGGLATVEAVYAALRIMKRPLDGLLDHYHWKDRFLKLNGWDGESS